MAKLLIKPNGLPEREIELKFGTNRIGRTADNDFQIVDASISSNHCEIVVGHEAQIFVRDLGSTNGTFLDRELVSEGYLRLGQKLHLGDVEIIYSAESAPTPPERRGLYNAPKPALRVAVTEPDNVPLRNVRHFRQPIYNRKTFFRQLPSTFLYPFKSNGIILLISGTVLFVLLDFVGKFSIILSIVNVLAFGYLFLYMQRIVQSSALGEEDMPGWPEISDWWEDIFLPTFLIFITFVVSFGPAVAMFFLDVEPPIKWTLGISLALFGCCYLPMALLAVAMYDSFFALNPMLIIPSILRIPMEYLVACFMLGLILGVRLISLFALDFISIPFFSTVISGFLALYFLAVEMRILGVMYHAKREELNWHF